MPSVASSESSPTGAGTPARRGDDPFAGRYRGAGDGERWTVLDLFAGCGGMTRGFVDHGGFVPVGAVELDHAAAATYAANFDPQGAHTFAGTSPATPTSPRST